VRVRFFVTKAYRGRLKSDVTVETSTGGPPWGYDFNKGQTYLVYAKTTSKEYTTLTVEGCSRTKLAADGEEDLKFIGGLPKPNPDILEVEGGLRAVSKPPPSYPREARDAGISGSVFVRVIIDETGKVISAQALCGPTELVAAAEKAISNWQFVPTRISGRPVKISTIVSSNFAP